MTTLPATTDSLITSLSRNVPRVPRHAVQRRLALGILAGSAVTVALVVTLLGVRADLGAAVRGFPFWMKLIYSLAIAIGALAATARLARPGIPDAQATRRLWPLAVPVLLLGGIVIGELAGSPAREWAAMWLGHSSKACPWLVLGLAVPLFCGLLWSFQRLAPTRLRLTGALAGLSAGGWAATLYCLHCPEASALFVLTWYTLGMLLACAAGALAGPKLLRW